MIACTIHLLNDYVIQQKIEKIKQYIFLFYIDECQ